MEGAEDVVTGSSSWMSRSRSESESSLDLSNFWKELLDDDIPHRGGGGMALNSHKRRKRRRKLGNVAQYVPQRVDTRHVKVV